MASTVKRKFNAILGLGTRRPDNNKPSSASSTADGTSLERTSSATSISSTMASDLEFLSKKRRVASSSASKLGYSALAGEKRPGVPKAPTTIANVTLRKWTPNGTVVASVAKYAPPPKYCPGDREQLIRRLATFQELTDWTPKPERVGEIEWAKRGWVCKGKERVKCTLCHKELVVGLNRKEVDGKEISVLIASDISEALVDKYVELMVTSHREECLWRKRGCDDSLLRLPLLNPQAILASLRQRYDELLERQDFLPYEFNLRLPERLDMDAVLAILPVNFFTEPPPPPNKAFPPDQAPATPREPNRSALALAILGWQGLLNAKGGSVPNSSSCHTCLRRLGLWMFKSKEVDVETNTVLVPAVMDNLDPLREHRFFCPWKNGAAQRNPGAKPLPSGEEHKAAWEILVQMIGNEAYVRNRVSSAHGRSKSSAARPSGSATPTSQRLRTPGRPTTASGPGANGIPPFDLLGPTRPDVVDVDDEETRRKKDQAMFARLRRVKSLFNTKGANKLKRSSLLPGTGHSNVGGEQA